MQLLQWGAKEKRIMKYVSGMERGKIVESSNVAKALNLDTLTTGKIIAILLAEKQIKVKRIANSARGCYRYEVL